MSYHFPFEILKVYKSLDHQKIRIGRKNDGGYVILDGLNYDLLIGCGIKDDDSFEHDFLNKYKNVQCLVFDGTINRVPHPHKRMKFIKKNIADRDTDRLTSLKNIIDNNKNIFLKMDIEGGEYHWLHCITEDQLSKINQITIEFHSKCIGLNEFDKYKYNVMEKLAKTHYLVHIHGNNTQPTSLYGEKEILIGNSNTNPKILQLHKKYLSNTGFRILRHPHPDKFTYKFKENKLIVTRTDTDSGWGYWHRGIINGNEIPNVFECTYVLKSLLPNVIENDEPFPHKIDQRNALENKEIELSGYPYTF